MYSRLQLARKYIRYYLTASNGKGHGIHSPFVFDFIKNVLNDGQDYPAFRRIEALRARLVKDGTMLEVEDMGAGSTVAAGRQRRIGEIARHAAKPPRLGRLLYRIAQYYRCSSVLELGTSLGLSTAYLASGGARVWTIEGAAAVAAVAEKNIRELGLEEVEVIVGNFDEKMEGVLDRAGGIDLAFIDGNHRMEPTLRYFYLLMDRCAGATILIFDDIHWSREMEEAWETMKQDPRVYLTIDLFFIGLVVVRDEFKVKQDFVIRF